MGTFVPSDAASRIADYIVDALRYDGVSADLLGDHPVRLSEATDSMGLLELSSYVEDEFGVKIGDEDIVRENFETVESVVALVVTKLAATTSSEANAG